MYRTIIEFKDNISENKARELLDLCDDAFENRAGKAFRRLEAPNRILFEGGDSLYGCLQLGILALNKNNTFKDCVTSWSWIDEDEPNENHCILDSLSTPIW